MDCNNDVCDGCEEHIVIEWCKAAIRDHGPVNKDYETGWWDGYNACEKQMKRLKEVENDE